MTKNTNIGLWGDSKKQTNSKFESCELNPWSIIIKDFKKDQILSCESIFSTGNGEIGQRANFEEDYSGKQLTGNYISGVYFKDRTKVSWWKNGYPDYFAKMVNCPNWNRLRIFVNDQLLDLNTCKEISFFIRELNMKEGWYKRDFILEMKNGEKLKISSKRFYSIKRKEIGAIKYSITPLQDDTNIKILPFIDLDVRNNDSNWNEPFIKTMDCGLDRTNSFVLSKVLGTEFEINTFSNTQFYIDGVLSENIIPYSSSALSETGEKEKLVSNCNEFTLNNNQELIAVKIGGYCNSNNYSKKELKDKSKITLKNAVNLGFDKLLNEHIIEWNNIWLHSDIQIKGDAKSQQGIRYNIFQLNQTFNGSNPKLNIGPKGFTGEKYGGVTYWDSEAFCIPFYLGTKNSQVAKNLINQRYDQLENAIKNAKKIGLNNRAALYPMATVNGEECHNEWEITFQEIHRNAAIVQGIKKYVDYSSDFNFIKNKGIEILIAVARFWAQRVNYSNQLKKYVILGVTGPNEYENNVDNNWYTNYGAKWCLKYTRDSLFKISNDKKVYDRILEKTNLKKYEIKKWIEIENNIHLPYSEEFNIFIQNDGFLNKEFIPAEKIPKNERPLNKNWSWDRILRSPYIKQADVLQGFYYFSDDFNLKSLENNFNYYEKFTVHESSLSASIHSIQSVKLNKLDKAYKYFLKASRLDLDDYNKEIDQGLHITSMGGAWMSIVEGFGGMKITNGMLSVNPKIPKNWKQYVFKLNFRDRLINIEVGLKETKITLLKGKPMELLLNNNKIKIG